MHFKRKVILLYFLVNKTLRLPKFHQEKRDGLYVPFAKSNIEIALFQEI